MTINVPSAQPQVHIEQVDGARIVMRVGSLTCIIDEGIDAEDARKGFRPVELLLGALGACTMGTMVNHAAQRGFSLEGVAMHAEASIATAPSRIATIDLTLSLPEMIPSRLRESLLRVGNRCKISNTLAPSVTINLVLSPPTADTRCPES